jgi:hypothetical protein
LWGLPKYPKKLKTCGIIGGSFNGRTMDEMLQTIPGVKKNASMVGWLCFAIGATVFNFSFSDS